MPHESGRRTLEKVGLAVRPGGARMKLVTSALAVAALVVLWLPSAGATMLFEANLTGGNAVPPNASPGTGFESVLLNDALNQITVDLFTFSNLTAPAIAAHIHGPAPAGVNGSVVFAFTGVPAATSGSIPEQTFAINPAQVAELESGLLYTDIHDANFPGGEIRGQLELVPEPATVSLLSMGLGGLFALRRRRP